MAENYELIAAKDLPTTDAAEIDVICVENGELKRKPGTSISGGYVIHLDTSMITSASEIQVVFTCNDSYDELAKVVYNGGCVWLDGTNVASMSMGNYVRVVAQSVYYNYELSEFGVEANISGMSGLVRFPNGTWTPPSA